MKKTLMKESNWIIVGIGIFLTYFSFFLISFITTNYDGLYAFFSIALTVAGIVTVILGLSLGFEKDKA
jgi:predicted membrane chloride channel (bestrophin family)